MTGFLETFMYVLMFFGAIEALHLLLCGGALTMKLNTALQWVAGAALLLGSLGPWAWAEAYSNHDAQQPSEPASAACREEAAWLRELRSSFDQGGSLGSWLGVAEAQTWRDLVVSVYLSELSPGELAAKHYAGCMLGTGWEVES